jgi:hypothetical protein
MLPGLEKMGIRMLLNERGYALIIESVSSVLPLSMITIRFAQVSLLSVRAMFAASLKVMISGVTSSSIVALRFHIENLRTLVILAGIFSATLFVPIGARIHA